MDFDGMAGVFRALGDPHRLRALHFLATTNGACCAGRDGICACDVQAHLGLAQPTVSHHMKILVEAKLVDAQKRGKWTYYTLSAQGLHQLGGLIADLQSQVPDVRQRAV